MVSTQQRTDDDSSQPVKASLKSYGITEPLSIAGPSAADVKRNLELEKFLVDEGLYESKEETMRREEVVVRIDQIVKHWVKQLTRQRGYTDQMVEDANAVIFTFGSYRLGVHGPMADIDTLWNGHCGRNLDHEGFVTPANLDSAVENRNLHSDGLFKSGLPEELQSNSLLSGTGKLDDGASSRRLSLKSVA